MTGDDPFPGSTMLRLDPEEDAPQTLAPRPRKRAALFLIAILVPAAAVVMGIFGIGTGYVYGDLDLPEGEATVAVAPIPSDPVAQKKALAKLRTERKRLDSALRSRTPAGYWVIVDQTQNRIYLKNNRDTVLDARCSAGSGMVLKEPEGGKGRRWVFDTPRGVFKVKNRVADPAWKKPDWAFVEEGKPIPRNDGDRIEYGTLGEYAFYLGDGYMIHGTLYERLLGRSVTHGCIRVGRDDLRVLWKHVQIGTPVYIY